MRSEARGEAEHPLRRWEGVGGGREEGRIRVERRRSGFNDYDSMNLIMWRPNERGG